MKPRTLYRRLRRIPESLLILAGAIVMPWWPRRCILALAAGIGFLVWRFSGRLTAIGRANLDLVYADRLTRGQKDDLLRQSFKAFALVLLDLFWFSVWRKQRVSRWVRIDPTALALFRQAGPCVGITAHLGNWELLAQALSLRGLPLLSLAARQGNSLTNRLLNYLRASSGHQVSSNTGSIKALLRCLRTGGRVGLLLDQNTPPGEGGEFVNFFGVPTPISRIAATLRERTGAEIIVAACLMDGRGGYLIEAHPALTQRRPGLPTHAITHEVAAMMEEMIQRYPGQWLWSYKRWRYLPPGANRAAFPFYAHAMDATECRP